MQIAETAPWFIFTTFVLGGLCWLLPALIISWALGHLYFAPLNEPTALFKTDTRFRISDLIVLAVHLQIVVGIAVSLTNRDAVGMTVTFITIFGTLIAFWWFTGIRMLSRAGVTYTWHRWIFLGLIMPLGYLSTLQLVASFLTIPLSLGLLIQASVDAHLLDALVATTVLLLSLTSIGMIYGSRTFCRQMVERARQERADRDGIEFDTSETAGVIYLPSDQASAE